MSLKTDIFFEVNAGCLEKVETRLLKKTKQLEQFKKERNSLREEGHAWGGRDRRGEVDERQLWTNCEGRKCAGQDSKDVKTRRNPG